MDKVIDASGLACPQPVVLTKKALEEAEEVTIVVDNPVSRDNVRRMAESQGCEVEVEERGDGIYLHLRKIASCEAVSSTAPASGPTVVVISSDQMGRGNQELGRILMRAFLHTLNEVSPRPEKLTFFTTGVKLTVEGSEVLEDLRRLAEGGTEILVCGTCLSYFDLKERVVVGQVSNMYSIAEALLQAGRLVTL